MADRDDVAVRKWRPALERNGAHERAVARHCVFNHEGAVVRSIRACTIDMFRLGISSVTAVVRFSFGRDFAARRAQRRLARRRTESDACSRRPVASSRGPRRAAGAGRPVQCLG